MLPRTTRVAKIDLDVCRQSKVLVVSQFMSSVSRVIIMWTSLMLITGVGAALGSLLFIGADHFSISIVEGLAAGAMLTMIAQTMLPEAYFKGGSIIGLATMAGFLAALFFKSI